MRYGQDNSVFVNMDMYQIENVVCYPFRTAILVDNGTIEGQIGEGCLGGIDRRGGARGDGGVEDFCGRGEDEFARGKHPGGMVLFKKKL